MWSAEPTEEKVNEMEDLQKQIDALTERIIELENRPQIPGPQGKPGNISAAVHASEEATAKLNAEHTEYVRGRIAEQEDHLRKVEAKLQDAVLEFSRAVVDGKRSFLDGLDANLDAKVLEIMQSYHLLGEDNAPSALYFMHQIKKELGINP
jgi:hypothetical protein